MEAVRAGPVEVAIEVDESKPGPAIPADFLGFSYEKNVLALDHFKPSNTAMVNLMRHLGAASCASARTMWRPPAGNRMHRSPFPRKAPSSVSASWRNMVCDLPAHRLDCHPRSESRSQRSRNGRAEAAEAQRIGGKDPGRLRDRKRTGTLRQDLAAEDYNYQDFSREVSSYLDAMRAKLPRIPLAGTGHHQQFSVVYRLHPRFPGRSGDDHPP